jgi:hypothetical protein
MTMQKRLVTRGIVATAGLVLVAGLFFAAHAAGTERSHRQLVHGAMAEHRARVGHRGRVEHRARAEHGERAWQPHDSGALPFGSARWWEQMLREGRINGDTM